MYLSVYMYIQYTYTLYIPLLHWGSDAVYHLSNQHAQPLRINAHRVRCRFDVHVALYIHPLTNRTIPGNIWEKKCSCSSVNGQYLWVITTIHSQHVTDHLDEEGGREEGGRKGGRKEGEGKGGTCLTMYLTITYVYLIRFSCSTQLLQTNVLITLWSSDITCVSYENPLGKKGLIDRSVN